MDSSLSPESKLLCLCDSEICWFLMKMDLQMEETSPSVFLTCGKNRIFLDYSSLFLFPCTLTGMERKHAAQNPCKNTHIYKQYCVKLFSDLMGIGTKNVLY